MIRVDPNIPLGMDDFAQLFLGGNGDANTNAQELSRTAPGVGRSYIQSQWNRIGDTNFPEQYFSRPEVVAAYAARGLGRNQNPIPPQTSAIVPPSVQASTAVGPVQVPAQWGPFRSDDERRIAIGTGAYDPNYLNPRAKYEAEALAAIRVAEQKQVQNYQARSTTDIVPKYDFNMNPDIMSRFYTGTNPGNFLTNRDELLRKQLAGDVTGTTARILRSRVGADPNTAGGSMQPYLPKNPSGVLDAQGVDTLDREIYDHPDFKKLLSDNPEQANFVYQRLTGRPLLSAQTAGRGQGTGGGSNAVSEGPTGDLSVQGDLNRSITYRNDRAKFQQGLQDKQTEGLANIGLDFVKEAQKRSIDDAYLSQTVGREFVKRNTDAIYDPVKKSWKVWKMAEAPVGQQTGISTAEPKPYRQLMPANDTEAEMLSRHWEETTGHKLDVAPNLSSLQLEQLRVWRTNPEYKQVMDDFEKKFGHAPTFNDVAMEINRTDLRKARSAPSGFAGIAPYIQGAGNALWGAKGTTEQYDPTTGQTNTVPIDITDDKNYTDQNMNWWGKFMAHPVEGTASVLDATGATMRAVVDAAMHPERYMSNTR